jgi:hypothetical protein
MSGMRAQSVSTARETKAPNSVGAHRAEADGFGGRDSSVFMPKMWEDLRGLPPFARPYCHHTRVMERFVCQMSRWMTLAEVAAVSGLCWDSVKEIVKSDLGKRYARTFLKGV